MLENQIDQLERKRVLDNDRKVRGASMHAFAEADAAIPLGRFTQVTAATVVGSTSNAAAAYPAASAAHQTELPPENPLGYAIDEMPLEPSSSVAQATDPTSTDAPSPNPLDDVQRARVGSLSQTGDPTPGSSQHLPTGPARMTRAAGSPVLYRRF